MNTDEPTRLGVLIAKATAARLRMQEHANTPEAQAERERSARLEAERVRRERDATADACGVPADVDVRRFAMEHELEGAFIDAAEEALQWRAERSQALRGRAPVLRVLGGPVGRGKTVALSWAVIHHGRGARYVTAAEIAAAPRNGFSTNEEQHRRWERTDLLCVDEVGIDTQGDTLVALLLARWSAGGATLLAGNLNRKAFSERYLTGGLGERLGDRLVGVQKTEGCDWYVGNSGPSLRGAGRGR